MAEIRVIEEDCSCQTLSLLFQGGQATEGTAVCPTLNYPLAQEQYLQALFWVLSC